MNTTPNYQLINPNMNDEVIETIQKIGTSMQIIDDNLKGLNDNSVPKSRTLNNKSLSDNITLNAVDIKANDGSTLEDFKGYTASQLADNAAQLNDMMSLPLNDDTASLVSALSQGGKIQLKKGKTYIVTQPLILLAGTELDGNGSTLKRANNTSGALISMQANCVIKNLTIDGNKTNQTSPLWTTYQEIATGLNGIVENVKISNAASEGIVVYYDNVSIKDCVIDTCGGNGIHFSGANHSLVQHCRVTNTNLTVGVGHEDGGIIFSNLCSDITVDSNYCESCKTGIGSIDYQGNSDLTIINNTVRNCVNSFDIQRIAPDDAPYNVIIKGNHIYDSGLFYLDNASLDLAYAIRKFIITDNYFYNTGVKMRYSDSILFANNIIEFIVGYPRNELLIIDTCNNLVCEGNILVNGVTGISINGTNSNILISNNILKNQTTSGIFMNNDSPSVTISDNNISNLITALATYYGIVPKKYVHVTGNTLNLLAGKYGIYASQYDYISNNVVRTPTGMPSIRCDGGTAGNIIIGNFTVQAINDVGASNQQVNNFIIT